MNWTETLKTEVEGAYGIAVISTAEPDTLIAARNGSPLLLGLVLGPIAERYMWTSVQLYGVGFLYRPGAMIIFALLVCSVAYPLWQDRQSNRMQRNVEI